jgi:hypothetical protein
VSISSRQSIDHLHTDVILGKITEYDIFVYYCPSFTKLGKKFSSELREDGSPTVSIIPFNGKLLYKDFGESDHNFSCFDYIAFKYNCDFPTVLRIIDRDFDLGLSPKSVDEQFTMGSKAKKQENAPVYSDRCFIIKKKQRPWSSEDAAFWGSYFVSKKLLCSFGVEPISHFWINGSRFTCKSITYAFKFKNRYKIYAPYEIENKWLSNTKQTDIQGYDQLPTKGERLIITSSLKDVLCLTGAGYCAVALQGEMEVPSEKLICELKERFQVIEILYDNDFHKEKNPGQRMAKKICDLYGFNNICIPDKFKCKDPSDLVDSLGSLTELRNILK